MPNLSGGRLPVCPGGRMFQVWRPKSSGAALGSGSHRAGSGEQHTDHALHGPSSRDDAYRSADSIRAATASGPVPVTSITVAGSSLRIQVSWRFA